MAPYMLIHIVITCKTTKPWWRSHSTHRLQMTMRQDICMKAIWASFPAISLDWIDERLDCLVFQHCFWLVDNIGICRKVISVKMIWDLFRKDLLQGSLKSTACGRNAVSQIKWLSCMFTSIFGDISMTMQAETLLKGEGWWCPFAQERAGVIHQLGCCPFSTARPSYLLLPTPPRLPSF